MRSVGALAGHASSGTIGPVIEVREVGVVVGDVTLLAPVSVAADRGEALLAAVTGASAVLVVEAPLLPAGVALVVIGVGMRRWRHRS